MGERFCCIYGQFPYAGVVINQHFQDIMVEQLTIDPWRIPVVAMSAVGTYIGFLILVKIFGTRVLAKMTAFDAVVLVMFGAVAGRVIIGHPPTLAAGLIGLATLMILEAIFGQMRKFARFQHTINGRSQVVMAHGKIIDAQLKKTRLSVSDVRLAIRRAGLPSMKHVQCMILEPTGDLSVIKVGEPIDPGLLKNVGGVEHIYP